MVIWSRVLLIAISVILGVIVMYKIITCLFRPKRMKFPVQTEFGPVVGVEGDDDTFAWLGVPYAKPPTASNGLRWKVPIDPDKWTKEYYLPSDAKDVPVPAQQSLITHKAIGSEDCLYINIWRPRNIEGDLPVYVWIFGGGNNVGSIWKYPGAKIAHNSNVIFVAIQYRVGPFGWLQYDGMDKSTPEQASGNFGTLDIFKGLRWVQNNIRDFGGDPNNVLLSGESAGAYNCLCAMLSPLAKGLFHKVLYESGGMYLRTKDEARATGVRLQANLAVGNNNAVLESIDTAELIDAFFLTTPRYSGAFRDGYMFPDDTIPNIIASGKYNKVPIMLGTNMNETKYICSEISEKLKNAHNDPSTGVKSPIPSGKHSYASIPLFIYALPWPSIDDILPTQADKNLYNDGNKLASLMWNVANSDDLATAFSKNKDQAVYVYRYTREGDPTGNYALGYGACHASEITYFFGYPDAILSPFGFIDLRESLGFWGETNGTAMLSRTMMSYASAFLRSGDPNKKGLPVWEPWIESVPRRMELDSNQQTIACKMVDGVQTLDDVNALRNTLSKTYSKYVLDTFASMVEIDLSAWSLLKK